MARGHFSSGDDQDDEPDADERLKRSFAAAGIVVEGAPRRAASTPVDYHLWPDCVPTWRIWCAAQTQWRIGFAGATGLDYTAVLGLIDRQHRRPAHRREVFSAVRAMERAALEAWAEQREQKQ